MHLIFRSDPIRGRVRQATMTRFDLAQESHQMAMTSSYRSGTIIYFEDMLRYWTKYKRNKTMNRATIIAILSQQKESSDGFDFVTIRMIRSESQMVACLTITFIKKFRSFWLSLSEIWSFQGIGHFPYIVYTTCTFWKLRISETYRKIFY